jgi:hypothetical protein
MPASVSEARYYLIVFTNGSKSRSKQVALPGVGAALAGQDHRAVRWAVFPGIEFQHRTADTRSHASHSPGPQDNAVSVTSVDECIPLDAATECDMDNNGHGDAWEPPEDRL